MIRPLTRLLLAAALAAAAGCHTGEFSKINQTQTVLTSNNYRVIQTGVRGSDSGFRVLGIGVSSQYGRAMQKLRILAELDDRPRALINVTADENAYNFLIVSGGELVITADVIEFTGPPSPR